MANGMTIKERLDDISKESGLSTDIVRRVLDAERVSIAKSLCKGENAMLIGRCIMYPKAVSKLAVGCTLERRVSLKVRPTTSLIRYLDEASDFDNFGNEEESGDIAVVQIEDLI